MKIAAHQPNYIPNLSFFNKLLLVDTFIILTNIQFEKHEGWQQRHKIPGPDRDIWLTVPVLGSQNQLIKEVKINNQIPWQKKQFRTLELIYGKSKGKEYLEHIKPLYEKKWDTLVSLNTAFIILLKEILEIKTPVIVDDIVSGSKHELLINVCKKYHATTYLSGLGAKDYLIHERLSEITANNLTHEFVKKNLTAEYPYSTIH